MKALSSQPRLTVHGMLVTSSVVILKIADSDGPLSARGMSNIWSSKIHSYITDIEADSEMYNGNHRKAIHAEQLSISTSSLAMAERPRELGDFKKALVNGGTNNHSLKDSHKCLRCH